VNGVKIVVAVLVWNLLSVGVGANEELVDHAFSYHTRDLRPTENLEVLTLQESKVFFFLWWKGIEPGKINHIKYMVEDGAGNIAHSSENVFKNQGRTRITWLKYRFDSKANYPGDWYFSVYLNGRLHLKKMIYVGE